jgi:hypothetical protein
MGCACGTYGLLVGKPDRNRPLGRPRCRWMDNITMDLADRMWWCGVAGLVWLRIGTSGEFL